MVSTVASQQGPVSVMIPLTAAASVSHGAGTDGTSPMAEMIWVASAEASKWDTNTEGKSSSGASMCVTCAKPLIHIVKTIHLLVSSSLQLQLQWGSIYGSIMALKLSKTQWLLQTKKPNSSAKWNFTHEQNNNRSIGEDSLPWEASAGAKQQSAHLQTSQRRTGGASS